MNGATPPLKLSFVKSATSVKDLPPTEAEIAVVGRSNVGKSSLINALANRNRLAKVSKTPGRTQLLNLFELGDGTTFMDLPGYGYAKVSKTQRAEWGRFIEQYLLTRENLRLILLLVDAEVGPTALDRQTIEWFTHEGLPFRIVATKQDKVKAAKREKRKRELAEGCGLPMKEILWVSADKNVNIAELRRRILEWLKTPGE